MKAWNWIQGDSDIDELTLTREISGRITKRRRKVIESTVRKYNRQSRHPYGTSPNGYGYTCGCSHDCCGCLVGKSMGVTFEDSRAILVHRSRYNY